MAEAGKKKKKSPHLEIVCREIYVQSQLSESAHQDNALKIPWLRLLGKTNFYCLSCNLKGPSSL